MSYELEAEAQGAIKKHAIDEEDAKLYLEDYSRRFSLGTGFSTGLAQAFIPWIQETLVWYKDPVVHRYIFLAEVDGLWRAISKDLVEGLKGNDIGQLSTQNHFERLIARSFKFIP